MRPSRQTRLAKVEWQLGTRGERPAPERPQPDAAWWVELWGLLEESPYQAELRAVVCAHTVGEESADDA